MGDILGPGVLFQRLSGAEGIKTEAQSAKNLAAFNEQVQKQKAKAEIKKATFAQVRQAEEGARIKSALKAKAGAAGGIGSLVFEDLSAEQAAELDLESQLIAFEGEVASRRALNQGKIDRFTGKVAKLRGRNQALAADVQFATSLAGFA